MPTQTNASPSSNSLSFQDSNSSPELDVQESKKPSKEPVEELVNDETKVGEGMNNQSNGELDLDFELKPLQL